MTEVTDAAPHAGTWVVLPTYDEAENLEAISDAILRVLPGARLLVVDDASPDGTGEIADRLAADETSLQVHHRAGKEGLGKAYVDGFDVVLGQVEAATDGLDAVALAPQIGRQRPRRRAVVLLVDRAEVSWDNVVVTVDAVVYYEATDPQRLVYNVADFFTAITKLAQTNLRNLIGDLELDKALTSRDTINNQLREVLGVSQVLPSDANLLDSRLQLPGVTHGLLEAQQVLDHFPHSLVVPLGELLQGILQRLTVHRGA